MRKTFISIVILSLSSLSYAADMEAVLARLDALETEVAVLRSRVSELECGADISSMPAYLKSGPAPVHLKAATIRPRTYLVEPTAPEMEVPPRHDFQASALYRKPKYYKPTWAGALAYTYSRNVWHAGISISEERRIPPSPRRDKTYTFGGTVYGGFDLSDGWYGKTSLFLGYSRDTVFLVDARVSEGSWVFEKSRARDNGYDFAASTEFGKLMPLPKGFYIKPHIGVDSASSQEMTFRDADGRRILDVKPHSSSRVPFGITLAQEFTRGNWAFASSLDLTLLHTIQEGAGGFSSFDGTGWNVYSGGNEDRLGTRISLGLKVLYKDIFDIGIDYAGEKTSSDYYGSSATENRISATFGLSF